MLYDMMYDVDIVILRKMNIMLRCLGYTLN